MTAHGQADEGQHFALTCSIVGDELLEVTSRSFQWERAGRNDTISREATLIFSSLSHEDEAEYICTVTINSPYLTGPRTMMTTERVKINCKYSNS